MIKEIDLIINQFYNKNQYPVLDDQISKWGGTKPLKGLTILDATPIFRNTLIKYKALLASGANITIGLGENTPFSEDIVSFLKKNNISITNQNNPCEYDIILDCGALFKDFSAKIGYSELTRSGVKEYQKTNKRVFAADSGKIKLIETALGTGEGYFRAMKEIGFDQWKGKTIVIVGDGKVGQGIGLYAKKYGATPIYISDCASKKSYSERVVNINDNKNIVELINNSFALVTATGGKNIFKDKDVIQAMNSSSIILGNMGYEDEFGDSVMSSRVLNNKRPINFILQEPTLTQYIDATMALHNLGALYLTMNEDLKGIINPPSEIEQGLIVSSINGNIASKEIEKILQMTKL